MGPQKWNATLTLLCLGITPLDDYVDTTEKRNWREEAAKWTKAWKKTHVPQGKVDDVGDHGLKEELDLAEEALLFGETTPQEVTEEVLEDTTTKGPPQTEKSGTMSLVMIGLAGAGILFFLR